MSQCTRSYKTIACAMLIIACMKNPISHKSNLLGHVQVVLAMCIVGSSVAVTKIISTEMPVFLASFLRFLIATLFLIPLNYRIIGKFAMPKRRELILLSLQAFFGVFLFSVCMFLGLKRTSAINAGVALGMLPAVTALMSVLILNERLTRRNAIGIALSMFGAILLEFRGSEGAIEIHVGMIGILLVLSAVVCESLFAVIGKLSGLTLPAIAITTWITAIGMVLFAPYAMVEAYNFKFATVSTTVWLLLLYYAVIVTVIGFTLFYSGLNKISSVAAGVHMAWAPLSAMLIAVVFMAEPFGLLDLLAASSVLAAVLLMSIGGKKPKQPHSNLENLFSRADSQSVAGQTPTVTDEARDFSA